MNKLDRVWEHSLIHPEGFTLSLDTMKPVTRGYAVAYLATQDSFGREGLEQVISHALSHQRVIGGWLNTQNNKYYFDSVRIFPDTEREAAERFAREQEQIAFFDLTRKIEIITE